MSRQHYTWPDGGRLRFLTGEMGLKMAGQGSVGPGVFEGVGGEQE